MSNQNPETDWLDDLLLRLTTGYSRKDLLELSEEDTGLDQFEVQEELKSVDKAKAIILARQAEAIQAAQIDENLACSQIMATYWKTSEMIAKAAERRKALQQNEKGKM